MYYVAHRLFALHDRALGALVAEELAAQVGESEVFLPFCDTDEERLVAECKGRRLYELDRARLEGLSGMIAVLHGPSLDDGVCMEIGFASQLGVPVVVLTMDFQTYGLALDGRWLEFPDPLVQALAHRVVRVATLGRPTSNLGGRFQRFRESNEEPIRKAAHTAVTALLTSAAAAVDGTPDAFPPPSGRAFVEASPYVAVTDGAAIARALESTGWEVSVSERLSPAATAANGEADTDSALRDWHRLSESELLVVDVNGPETPPGAALMIGASAAASRPVVAVYAESSFTFASGREPNFRNLMIQYAIDQRVRLTEQLPDVVGSVECHRPGLVS
jgi:Nucleoside 2-deoxyribosyltransferase